MAESEGFPPSASWQQKWIIDLERRAELAESHRESLAKVEMAARAVVSLLHGEPGNWKLDGREVTEPTGDALISLNAYLNDVAYHREAALDPKAEENHG